MTVGVAVKLFVPARYTANATIYVFSTEGETSTQVINVADKMTTDFQIIGTTSTTLNLVIEELGLDTTVEELKKAAAPKSAEAVKAILAIASGED